MPSETLSDKGPGGGGWIYINKQLQVTDKTVFFFSLALMSFPLNAALFFFRNVYADAVFSLASVISYN